MTDTDVNEPKKNPLEENLLDEPDAVDPAEYAKELAKQIITHLALGVAVLLYVVGGAFLFQEIELEDEQNAVKAGIERSWELETLRGQVAQSMWDHKWSIEYNTTVRALLDEYHQNITDAISDHGYGGVGIIEDDVSYSWGFSSALLFTMTVVTTIGYGHIAPASELGQLVCILYALIGIPLMLAFLANIGDAMAKFFRITYGRGCCWCCNSRREKEYTVGQREYVENQRLKQQKLMKDRAEREGSAVSRPRSAWDEDSQVKKRNGSADSKKDKKDKDKKSKDKDGKDKDKDKKDKDGKDEKKDGTDGDPDLDQNLDDIVFIPPEALKIPDEEINVPISLTLVVIAAYVMIGAVIFQLYNGWTWITGAYFSLITLSTIGFGDLTPEWDTVGTTSGNIKLAITSFYIIMGLAVISMAFNLMMEEMLEKVSWLAQKIGISDKPAPADDAAQAVAQNADDFTDTAKLVDNAADAAK